MKTKYYLHSMMGMLVFLLGIGCAQASMIVYEDAQVVSDDTIFTTAFEVTEAGTYKAELVDFEFPVAFDILSLMITQDLDILGYRFDTGSFTFNVSTPGTLMASLAAIPGNAGPGAYALQISSVPIPASAILFFSGLIGLIAVGRRV